MITMRDRFMTDQDKEYLELLSASLNVEEPVTQEIFDDLEIERDQLKDQVEVLTIDLTNEIDRADGHHDALQTLRAEHQEELDELNQEHQEQVDELEEVIAALKAKLAKRTSKSNKAPQNAYNGPYTGLKLVGDN